jgi:hypothetical protein
MMQKRKKSIKFAKEPFSLVNSAIATSVDFQNRHSQAADTNSTNLESNPLSQSKNNLNINCDENVNNTRIKLPGYKSHPFSSSILKTTKSIFNLDDNLKTNIANNSNNCNASGGHKRYVKKSNLFRSLSSSRDSVYDNNELDGDSTSWTKQMNRMSSANARHELKGQATSAMTTTTKTMNIAIDANLKQGKQKLQSSKSKCAAATNRTLLFKHWKRSSSYKIDLLRNKSSRANTVYYGNMSKRAKLVENNISNNADSKLTNTVNNTNNLNISNNANINNSNNGYLRRLEAFLIEKRLAKRPTCFVAKRLSKLKPLNRTIVPTNQTDSTNNSLTLNINMKENDLNNPNNRPFDTLATTLYSTSSPANSSIDSPASSFILQSNIDYPRPRCSNHITTNAKPNISSEGCNCGEYDACQEANKPEENNNRQPVVHNHLTNCLTKITNISLKLPLSNKCNNSQIPQKISSSNCTKSRFYLVEVRAVFLKIGDIDTLNEKFYAEG